mmetsp:Transcript_57801/g.161305  ORF Transcript_57801/g.161305 Transcript_57801/m.161305 type:complete len:384 (-) Transcript_57801:147-1298(-)
MSGDDAFRSQDEVLALIAESWAEVNKRREDRGAGNSQEQVGKNEFDPEQENKRPTSAKSTASSGNGKSGSGLFSRWTKKFSKSVDVATRVDTGSSGSTHRESKKFEVPDTFDEMVKLNAGMTGANLEYITIVLSGFGNLVTDICKFGELREQTDILAMRIAKDVRGNFKTVEFKVCMLASMRALLPATWNTKLEHAWMWLWDSVEVQLKRSLELPLKYEKSVANFVGALENKELRDIGMNVWKRMFAIDPEAENVFRQSNERLIFIVQKAFEFSARIFKEPTRMNDDLRALGLRHIMFGAKPKNFATFVQCVEQELIARNVDEVAVAGTKWSMQVVACIMARTVEEGSTPLLMAALSNKPKELKKVLAQTPRGKRAQSMLGTA